MTTTIYEGACNTLDILATSSIPVIRLSYVNRTDGKTKVNCSGDLYRCLLPTYDDGEIDLREIFKVLLLNYRMNILGIFTVSVGFVDSTNVDVRLIVQAALLANASRVVLCHNHPSGNPDPSQHDRVTTHAVGEACKLVQIKMLDHIILSRKGYYSFADEGTLTY